MEDHTIEKQYNIYHKAKTIFCSNPEYLISIENFLMREIIHFIDLYLPEIQKDYNEASYLFPFWKNYIPLDRGRSPKGDQYPWIEVGENVFGNKLLRHFSNNFSVKDTGLPSGADDRCVIASERIHDILKITNSVWVFIDIKSSGPRDDFDHAVLSPYQVSGSGDWAKIDEGLKNAPVIAMGKRNTHEFLCSLSPIYILSDGLIVPLVTFVIKPVYSMLINNGVNIGQPLQKIQIACIPNGILLELNPNYNKLYPGLFFPGKDDKKKYKSKKRARISFDKLKKIASWRIFEISL